MTSAELLGDLLRINLVLGAAIVAVLTLRKPARRLLGPSMSYGLWALVPIIAAASLAPPRRIFLSAQVTPISTIFVEPLATSPAPAIIQPPAAHGLDMASAILALWLVGVVFSLGLLAWRQHAFLKQARAGLAGPALVGVLRPSIVTPSDFETRFNPAERQMVLAHERMHIARQDARINGLMALAQCVCWFNPLVHLAVYFARIDQEIACDAAVQARHPADLRTYAEALIKSQLAHTPLPLGCYWPARFEHPLTERIAMLKMKSPAAGRRWTGGIALALVAAGGGYAAWAAQPATVVAATAPSSQSQPAAPATTRASTPPKQAMAGQPKWPDVQPLKPAPPQPWSPGPVQSLGFDPAQEASLRMLAAYVRANPTPVGFADPSSLVDVTGELRAADGTTTAVLISGDASGQRSWVAPTVTGAVRLDIKVSGSRLVLEAAVLTQGRITALAPIDLKLDQTLPVALPGGAAVSLTPHKHVTQLPTQISCDRPSGDPAMPFCNYPRVYATAFGVSAQAASPSQANTLDKLNRTIGQTPFDQSAAEQAIEEGVTSDVGIQQRQLDEVMARYRAGLATMTEQAIAQARLAYAEKLAATARYEAEAKAALTLAREGAIERSNAGL